jgi:hypothetical protein
MCQVVRDVGRSTPSSLRSTGRKAYARLEQLRPSDEQLASIRKRVLDRRAEFEPQFAFGPDDQPYLAETCRRLGVTIPTPRY